jgi:uncharacterized protein (DUF983 family)
MPEGNKFKAIITGKCPQCQQGSIFQYKWWQLNHFTKMNKICPICQVNFEVEPGFFYGAMYMSYFITVGIVALGGFAIYNIFDDPSQFYYIIPITLVSLLFTPINFRISRILYLHSMSGIKFKKFV